MSGGRKRQRERETEQTDRWTDTQTGTQNGHTDRQRTYLEVLHHQGVSQIQQVYLDWQPVHTAAMLNQPAFDLHSQALSQFPQLCAVQVWWHKQCQVHPIVLAGQDKHHRCKPTTTTKISFFLLNKFSCGRQLKDRTSGVANSEASCSTGFVTHCNTDRRHQSANTTTHTHTQQQQTNKKTTPPKLITITPAELNKYSSSDWERDTAASTSGCHKSWRLPPPLFASAIRLRRQTDTSCRTFSWWNQLPGLTGQQISRSCLDALGSWEEEHCNSPQSLDYRCDWQQTMKQNSDFKKHCSRTMSTTPSITIWRTTHLRMGRLVLSSSWWGEQSNSSHLLHYKCDRQQTMKQNTDFTEGCSYIKSTTPSITIWRTTHLKMGRLLHRLSWWDEQSSSSHPLNYNMTGSKQWNRTLISNNAAPAAA